MSCANSPGLARFSVLSELSLRHAQRASMGATGLACPWLPASLRVSVERGVRASIRL